MVMRIYSHKCNGMTYSSLDNRYLIDWHRFTVPYENRIKIIHNEFTSHSGCPMNGIRIAHFDSYFHQLIFKILATMDMTYFRHLTFKAAHKRLCYIMHNLLKLPFGNQGYNAQFAHLNMKINYNVPLKRFVFNNGSVDLPENRADMGIMVDISGNGCRSLDYVFRQTNTSWCDHFKELNRLLPSWHEDRLDINYDIFDAPANIKWRITPLAILRQAKYYHLQTKAHSLKFTGSIKSRGGRNTGYTVYIASKSQRLLRIYQKWYERKYHHHEVWRSKKGYWIRWEFENKGDYSRNIVKLIANGVSISTIFYSELNKIIKIGTTRYWHSKNGKSHHKFKAYKWWWTFSHESFAKPIYYASNEDPELDSLNDTTKIKKLVKISGPTCVTTHFLNTNNWIENSIAKSLVSELIAFCNLGGDPSALLNHLIQQGKIRIKNDPNAYKRIRALQFSATNVAKNYNNDEVIRALDKWIRDFELDNDKKHGFRFVKHHAININVNLIKKF